MERRLRLIIMMEIAMMVALSMVIDLMDNSVKMGPYSFSISMVPVLILAIRRGILPGMTAGLVWGLLQIVIGDIGGSTAHPAQLFLDYPLAFSMLGLAGIAHGKNNIAVTIGSIVLAIVARYVFHFISGIVFFGSYAPKGQPAWIYSLIVNGGTMLPNLIACTLIIILINGFSRRLLNPTRV